MQLYPDCYQIEKIDEYAINSGIYFFFLEIEYTFVAILRNKN
jgi:hypothetical protein